MFCSNKCFFEANKNFHQFECGFCLDELESFFTKAIAIALKTFFQALTTCGCSIEELRQLFQETMNKEFTVFDLDINGKNFGRMHFKAINSLCTNQIHRTVESIFRRYAAIIVLEDFLYKKSSFKNYIQNETGGIFFIESMFKLTQIAESNFHELHALTPNAKHQVNEQYGLGCYSFASLLSHSCAPNVMRLTFDGLSYIVVSRKISKGEQIFDNYG